MITPENKILNEFWKDTALKDTVHEYLIAFLKEKALERLFEDEEKSTYGFSEAKMVIDKAFTNLDDIFEPKAKASGTNSPR